ncbi:MAG: hypothetical protein OXI89_04930 [Gemmatimonadota bacterium]|nr:hypothetical protein [Gemmatimonadota bacterium]
MHRAISAFAAVTILLRAAFAFAAVFALLQADPLLAQTGAESGWFNTDRTQALVLGIILTGAILLYVVLASAGRPLFIRKIAGLDTVEEAVGRATEMGKPILYVPGLNDMDEVQTIASMNLLGHLATIIAGYDSRLHVPVRKSLVMSVARETVQQSYLSAGRPDAYQEDDIHYVSDAQFAYAAAVDGIIVREKPAACFYLGGFYAESLILAETGNSIGAIQIAGTARPPQLPFFVAACDYTLIGEELFAASAYLSKEPRMLGSLKGQDAGKGIAIIFIIAGSALATLESITGSETVREVSEIVLWLFR